MRLRRDQRQQEGIGTRVVGRGRNPDGTWKKRAVMGGRAVGERKSSTELRKKTSRELNVHKRRKHPHVSREIVGSPLAGRKSARLEKGRQGGSVRGHPMCPDIKSARPDILCPGAPILTVSLRLHLVKRQRQRKYRTEKILFADVGEK